MPGLWYIVLVFLVRPAEPQVGSVLAGPITTASWMSEDFLALSVPRNLTVTARGSGKDILTTIGWLPPANCEPGYPSSYRYVIIEGEEMFAHNTWTGHSYRGEVIASTDCHQPIVHTHTPRRLGERNILPGQYRIRLWASYKGTLGTSANTTFRTWNLDEVKQGFQHESSKTPYRSEKIWDNSEPRNLSVDIDPSVPYKITFHWQRPASLQVGKVGAYSYVLLEDDHVYLDNYQIVEYIARVATIVPADPMAEFQNMTWTLKERLFRMSNYYRLRMWALFNGTDGTYPEGRPSEPLHFKTPPPLQPDVPPVSPNYKPFAGGLPQPGSSDVWWRADPTSAEEENHNGTTTPEYAPEAPVGIANHDHALYAAYQAAQKAAQTPIQEESARPDTTTTSRPRFNGMAAIVPVNEQTSSSTDPSARERRDGHTPTSGILDVSRVKVSLSDMVRQENTNIVPGVSYSVSEPAPPMSFAMILLICMPCIALFVAVLTTITLLFLRVKRK